jgi:hypothetical protein
LSKNGRKLLQYLGGWRKEEGREGRGEGNCRINPRADP